MSLIESYNFTEDGLHPVLIRDSWQVAKLNYSDQYLIENIHCLIKHQKSDKGVSLLVGNAVLIIRDQDQKPTFKIIRMKQGTSYNIPKNMAYAIVMSVKTQLFIVERPNTHRDDVIVCDLSETELEEIKQNINQEFNDHDE